MPKAIQFFRSIPRWLLTRALSKRWPAAASGALSCIRLRDIAPPPLPTPEWARIKPRLSGICGSDLAAIACKGSPYFSPFISTPFVLGHEIVGNLVEIGGSVPSRWKCGMRVVIEPALCCEARGIQSPCKPCADGYYAHCENILKGSIQGGIQTGYCASTGGGWSDATVVVHHSQLHATPENLSDEQAALAEPLACATHIALKAPRDKHSTLLVLGCGTLGLLTIGAYRLSGGKGKVLASAWFAPQVEMARALGADDIFTGRGSENLYKWVLERVSPSAPRIYHPELGKPIALGGADCVLDCVASSQTLDDAMRLTRPRGSLIVAGMPGIPQEIDWTSVWYKELRVEGAYAYGWEDIAERGRVKTMQLALEYLGQKGDILQRLVNRRYALPDYRAALAEAFDAGRSGAFKTVFDLR